MALKLFRRRGLGFVTSDTARVIAPGFFNVKHTTSQFFSDDEGLVGFVTSDTACVIAPGVFQS